MRVYIINTKFESTFEFEKTLNDILEDFEKKGREVVNVQVEYHGFKGLDMPRPYHYFVTIVYKEPKE